jgi:hypothetical protein
LSIRIAGRIAVDGTWRIKAQLYYNARIYPNEMEFLIDTGAESTVICDKDAKRMGLGYHSLKTKEKEMGGAGHCMGRPLLKAGIVFSENGKINNPDEVRQIYVPHPKDYRTGCNLVGLDVLGFYNVFTNIKLRKVVLKRIQTAYMFGDE